MQYSVIILLFVCCSGPLKTPRNYVAHTADHSQWNTLLQKHVNDEGNVNYKAFALDKKKLDDYLLMLAKNPIAETAPKNEILSYYINLYNAGTVQLILENYPIKSIKDISKPWDKDRVKIGNDTYSLGAIEHKILRKMNEPRIHFAINCASYSCPRLLNEAFTASKIEAQLEASAIAFINDSKRNKITANTVQLSKIFKWFKKDFTTQGSLGSYVNNYAKNKFKSQTTIKYLDYDWSLNDSETP